jgi:hypothetical protein
MAAERLLLLAKLLAVLTNPPLKGWQADAMGGWSIGFNVMGRSGSLF